MLLLRSLPLLLLLGAPRSFTEGAATALNPDPVLEWQDKGIFVIQSESLKKCIQAGKSSLILENCKPANKHMLWKWVSNHRLFNIGGSGCLGLNLSNPEQLLSIYECDSTHVSLRWRCNRNMITGPLQYTVQVNHNNVLVASWKYLHKWISYMSGGGSICEYLHKDLYTIKGNAHGTPCMFPFQYNHQWHHECTREGREDNLLWCATTSRYERDEKWGFCPDPTSAEVGCDAVWEKDLNSHICYQFNLLSSLSWSEAHSSCQMQGGALLSIADENEENFIRKHLGSEAVEMWIGLNQLDENAGWQWSDRTPLNYLNWNPEISFEPFVEYHCGTLNSLMPNAWQSRDCGSTLPYICKKYLNHSDQEVTEKDAWKYYTTYCEPGWNPHNRNCYKLQKEKKTWKEALHSCQSDNSTLINIASLAQVEFLITLLGDENASETWIGLSSNKIPVSFEWSNGSSVTFTNWHALEPQILPNRSQLCVSAEQSEGHWKVKNCEETLFYVCKKAGHVLSDTESGCQKGWERHGRFCYKIDTVLRSFDHASSGYYCPPALVTITNRFEQAFITSLISSVVKTKGSYFWIALQDQNGTGEYTWKTAEGQKSEPVQYTHWNAYQPLFFWPFFLKCLLVKIPKDPRDWKNWTSAQDFCVEEGGTLVAIENEVEQAFITMNLFGQTTNVWIGLQNGNYEKWLNGKAVAYSNWSPFDINIPSHNITEVQKHIPLCALLSSNPNFHFTGKWYFEDCGKEGHGFVCEKMQDTSGHSVNTSDMYPVPNTLEYGNRTYKIINANMTWYTAIKTCLMHGAELASITDQYHQSFLTVILHRLGHPHWIGLFTADNGLNFDWSDGTKSSFTFWKDDESSILGDCVFADTSGRWSSTACESFLQGAICHVPTETKPFGHPELCSETSIPWIKFKSNCYSFSTVLDSTSFEAAHEFCKKEGSNLLTIKDETENSFLLEELFAFGSSVQMVWLNAHFDGDNETIKWFDGTPTDQSNWGIRKPEADHVKPHLCIALRIPEGVWQSSPCQEKKGFICKMEADIHTIKEHSRKGPSHSIVPLAVALTLIVILAISALSFCIYKHNRGIFRRLAGFGNPYYPTTNFSTVHLEENILISDLEKNDQ
uniref:secretory phospholipase A2 receptor n=1 Tax=Panthera onca TaxID=9690 RepID=UPI00295490D4|nr:secretory phospholipase A2 receptor [Panthera onca]